MTAPMRLVVIVVVGVLSGWLAAHSARVLPPPDEPFQGTIGRTQQLSKPAFLQPIRAPKALQNVLVVMIDDMGFGQMSCYGGPIPTPNLDRLAKNGLRYTRYHTPALCSPSRACFLTGRAHHECAMGVVPEIATGYPGYNARIPKSCALVSEVLRQNGYSTAAYGKWHLTPIEEMSPAGPFDRWPIGQGFEQFYGFLGGETNQWHPLLMDGVKPIHPPRRKDYHLTTDIADQAIGWLRSRKGITPDKPFFLYWAPGAVHAPHHAPREWIARFKGKFDAGWDRYREETLARQIKMGIAPKGTKLAPRPPGIKPWAELSGDEKTLFARMMEVFAGFLAHTDHEIGRMVQALEDLADLDNTLIIATSDNGASAEGGLAGGINLGQYHNGEPSTVKEGLAVLDDIGSPKTENHYPAGWGWAGNAPFPYFKQTQHLGGTRVPLILHWPKRITDRGGIRTQFHHATDIVPTLLEATRVAAPVEVNGIKQKPLAGISLAYTFADGKARDRRTKQYFEMFGHRGMYEDGWYAVTFHGRLPWQVFAASRDFADDKWELYHLDNDFGMANDLAAREPKRLRQLQDLWWAEAGKRGVLPLDDRSGARQEERLAGRPQRTRFVLYPGSVQLPLDVMPNVRNRSHTITAEVDIPRGGAEGILCTCGGSSAGYALLLQGGRLVYTYNHIGRKRTTITSRGGISPGKHTLQFEFTAGENKPGAGGVGRLLIDGKIAGQARLDKTAPHSFALDETFDVGEAYGSPVDASFADKLPFKFTGTLHKLIVDLEPK